MLTACFGTFLAGGLLYVGYLKPVLQRFQDNPTAYRWRDVAGYSPFLGPVFPMVYFLAGVVMVFGAWVPVEGRSRKMTSTDLNWYIVPTVGVSLFGIGIVYWMALVWILPLFKHKSSLRVTRTPYLDRNENFRYEEVKVTWLDPEAEDSDDITRLREEVDPDLGR